MPIFECLFFLENTLFYLLEIRRTDLPIESEVSGRLMWLRVDKDTMEITRFNFRSMDSAGQIEERFFEEGYLKFNITEGTFIEKYNSAQHPLSRRTDWKLSTSLINLIGDFISLNYN